MAIVLRSYTAAFDTAKEQPNLINPIPGESLLRWLIEQAKGTVAISMPAAEDWGWYSYVEWKGRKYLLGASASEKEEDGQREWVLQIDKHISLKEKFLNRADISHDDECVQYFKALLSENNRFGTSGEDTT